MSRVTGVTIICELSDYEDRPGEPMAEVIAWITAHPGNRGWALTEISDHAGGSKHPQFEVWCGGFNFFEDAQEEFAAFVMSRDWDSPENLVLIMEPEEVATLVYRPDRHAVLSVVPEPQKPAPMKAVGPPPAFPDKWGNMPNFGTYKGRKPTA